MKRALVIGCGDRVWQDVAEAQKMCSHWDGYYLVKLAGVHWKGPERFVWVTLHPEFMKVDAIQSPTWKGQAGYCRQRRELGLHDNYELVSPLKEEVGSHTAHTMDRHITYRWPGMSSSGGSGFFGVKVAVDDGYDRIVLCGIPMTVEGKHFTRHNPWAARDSFTAPWTSHKQYYADKTRSLSGGWTEKLLGRPTPEWLGVMSDQAAAAIAALPETV